MKGLRSSWLGFSKRMRIVGAAVVLTATIAGGLAIAAPPQASAMSTQQWAISLINTCGFGSKEPGVGLWSKGTQWNDLVYIWQHESSWSSTAMNPGPGHAYGIPQALGHGTGGAEYPKWTYTCTQINGGKQPTYLANPPMYGGTSNAEYQILWGLLYIRQVYYDPSTAYQHWQIYHNY